MKFAHEFKTVLIQEGFPSHWVDSAIPYGQLKKCIKRVASELRAIGLDSATLAQLIPDTSEELDGVEGSGVAFRYDFDGETLDSHRIADHFVLDPCFTTSIPPARITLSLI